ncbi:hypothetical protein [Micromonospora sp. NPDC002717]|uniref:hypothetical protein n=1 Tax=Micromonospora sp. NPDC002717 TaxID=3154424 RepID=UPI0033294DF7
MLDDLDATVRIESVATAVLAAVPRDARKPAAVSTLRDRLAQVTALAITRGGQADLHQQREHLRAVYREVHNDNLHDPFYSEPRYQNRLETYAARDGFALATGVTNGEMVGYALGCTLPAGARWWIDMVNPIAPGLITGVGHPVDTG